MYSMFNTASKGVTVETLKDGGDLWREFDMQYRRAKKA
jgi:hypothetical protein